MSLLIDGVSIMPWERFIIKRKYSASTPPSIPGAVVTFGTEKKVETPKNEYDSEKVVEQNIPRTQAHTEARTEITSGTACTICSDEHLSRASGALAEAMRFARDTGIKDAEVIRRVRAARDELNEMERFDLAPDTVAQLPDHEKGIANWALVQSMDLRHEINALISGRVEDLERVSAHAIKVSDEFMQKLWNLPGCSDCAKFYRRRRSRRSGSSSSGN